MVVTHGDSARNLIIFLKNLISKDEISATRVPIGNDIIYELLIR